MVTDAQVKKLMEELNKHGQIGLAAARAGMDRGTARRWRDADALPSESRCPRTYRTRQDPFQTDWPMLVQMLEAAPDLEAKTLFEWLMDIKPDRYQEGQLRTLQRKVKRWRAQHGPAREVFFPQCHRPGEAAQLDFTDAGELQVTIGGEPFPHLVGHFVLPYSNWSWPTVCRSESLSALSKSLQEALFTLGWLPEWLQTDNSSAATHDVPSGKRAFNKRYLELVEHFGIKVRTTAVGMKEQNGDVEAANGAFKRRVEQHLLLRGSRDFDEVAAYEAFLRDVAAKANRSRSKRLAEDTANMRRLTVKRRPVFQVVDVKVTNWSTIRVLHNAYSVPSRLIGERVRARVFDERIEVWYADALELTMPRLAGRNRHRVDYRHVVWSLVRKPGAFERYRYREDLFPSPTFRRAYDALTDGHSSRRSDLAYIRVLHLAASTSEADVTEAIDILLEAGQKPVLEAVRDLIAPVDLAPPTLDVGEPDLDHYDQLLTGGVR